MNPADQIPQEPLLEWAAILVSSPRSTEERIGLAEKLREAFFLSKEDAYGVIGKAPIVILDELTKSGASELKAYFGSSGVEVLVTRDTNIKAKCHRIVWPAEPDFSSMLRRKFRNLAESKDLESAAIDEEQGSLPERSATEKFVNPGGSFAGELAAEKETAPPPAKKGKSSELTAREKKPKSSPVSSGRMRGNEDVKHQLEEKVSALRKRDEELVEQPNLGEVLIRSAQTGDQDAIDRDRYAALLKRCEELELSRSQLFKELELLQNLRKAKSKGDEDLEKRNEELASELKSLRGAFQREKENREALQALFTTFSKPAKSKT